MKKVTILALHLGYGGIEKYLSSLCKMLETNFQIEIISTYKVTEKPAFDFSDNVKITYLISDKPYRKEMKEALKSFKIITFLKYLNKNIINLFKKYLLNIKKIKKINSDVIITTRSFHNKLVSKYAKSNILKIATEHNYHNNNQKYINDLISSLKNIDYLVVVSKELETFYKDKIGTTKCLYIPNVIEKKYTKPKYNTNHNLISIGRLSHEKGFGDLVDVVKLVKEKIPDIKLHLIGDGILKNELKEKIAHLDLDKNIIMHGFLNQEQIKKIMLESSLYVMTSFTESFGLVLIEAMSYGVPCVAFNSSSGARQVIKNEKLLIQNRDNKKLADLIVNLLNNEDLLIKYGKEAYINCETYLLDNIKEKWLDLINEQKSIS